ncbi:hypothetical protein B484DRAFT_363150, partial [Ochromonadaceae sp. CCMP2298]
TKRYYPIILLSYSPIILLTLLSYTIIIVYYSTVILLSYQFYYLTNPGARRGARKPAVAGRCN